MHHLGDQTKIHINPDFIPRGGAAKPKVHINPAFLQKSQETLTAKSYVTSATIPTTTTTTAAYPKNRHHIHGLPPHTNGHAASQVSAAPVPHVYSRGASASVYPHSSTSVHSFPLPSSGNAKTRNLYLASSDSDLYTKAKVTNSAVATSTSNITNHGLYSKSNRYHSYNKSYSINAASVPQAQNMAKNVVGKPKQHSSSYTWQASNAKTWTSISQVKSSASVDIHINAYFVKQQENVKQQYTYSNPSVKYSALNKSITNATTVTKKIGVTQKVTHHNEKPAASQSSLHSISSTKNLTASGINPATVSDKFYRVKANPTNLMQEVGQTGSSRGAENTHLRFHLGNVKSTKTTHDSSPQSTTLGGATAKHNFITVPKAVVSKTIVNKSSDVSSSQVMSPGRVSNPAQLTQNEKYVSRNKLVNSSYKKPVDDKTADLSNKTMDLSNSNTQAHVKTSRQKGNYNIITKTKLVRSNSTGTPKSKLQQQGGLKGQPVSQGPKTTHTLPNVTTVTRAQKLSPALRTHPSSARHSPKRRYSVISRTKLVRSQSKSEKPTTSPTSAKPKYSVITKNKLIRRRSSSGSGGTTKSLTKGSKSKAKTNKPEMERQRKFHVLSKTKIVRRKSGSGARKTSSSSPSLVVTTPAHHRKRAIVKRHKLVRNVSQASAKHGTHKMNRRSIPKKVNTAFKLINTSTKMSAKQRLAKGIISKYKINRVKVDSLNTYRKQQKFFDYSSKARTRNKFKFQNKKVNGSKQSDRFINIGGILYKSTKTSLRKQLPKAKNKTTAKKSDISCTILLRGEKFRLTAGGKTLQRVVHSPTAKTSLPRVHLGGLTYTRTRTGHYELTGTHQARALLSSAHQRSVVTLMQKRRKAMYQRGNEYCIFFNRFGRCAKKSKGQCHYIHDPSKVAICTRFLRGRCPVNNCPFSHTINPDKMPVCSHFIESACTREDCPYRHVKVNPSAPVCLDFVRGHCKAGEECEKQHILVCEEYKTGKCPRGASCPLSHHKGPKRPKRQRRNSARRASLSLYRKRKRSESLEILGGPVVKKRVVKKRREEPKTSQQRYFHLVTAEDGQDEDVDGLKTEANDTEELEKELPEEKVTGVNRVLTSDCDKQVSKEANDEMADTKEDGLTQTGTDHNDESARKSALEETRSRLMKKVDLMKKSHLGLFSDGLTNDTTADLDVNGKGVRELRDSNQTSSATKEATTSSDEPRDPKQTSTKEQNKSEDEVSVVASEASTQACNDAENPSNANQSRVQKPSLPKRLPSYIPLTMDGD